MDQHMDQLGASRRRGGQRRRRWSVAVVAALLVPLLLGPAGAQTSGVSVSPPVNDFSLADGESWTETITVGLDPGLAVGVADVYFLADTTGSMGSPIAAVRDGASQLVADLEGALPEVDLAFGVGDFKDFPDDSYAFRHAQSITKDAGAVQAAIDDWSAFGGGDIPEGQFYAYDQLAENRAPSNDGSPAGTIGWRSGARRILVVFADAPGHDPVCSAITQTVPGHGVPYDITEASVTAKLQDTNTVFIGISTVTGSALGMDADPGGAQDYLPDCGPETTGTAGQATRLAEATGGVHLLGIDDDLILEAIEEAVTTAALSIDSLTLQPTGATADFVSGISPETGFGPISTDEAQTLTFEVDWLGNVAATEADQVFEGTLDVVADGVVIGQKTVRITVPGTGPPAAPPATPVAATPTFTG